jgi:hypothetical protein
MLFLFGAGVAALVVRGRLVRKQGLSTERSD